MTGCVTDELGRPLRHLLIEVWNANTHGRYRHREDQSGLPLDPNFLGEGRLLTDDEGRYHFRTIRPGAYLARPDIGRWRPRYIHLSLRGGGARLITQIYFPGDPYNDTDPMRILMGNAFDRNLAREAPVQAPDLDAAYGFYIVIGGRNVTMFEP